VRLPHRAGVGVASAVTWLMLALPWVMCSNPVSGQIGPFLEPCQVLIEKMKIDDLAPWKRYFECAAELEAHYGAAHRGVVWLLVSDSVDIRRLAQAEYGHKVNP
jgi:hypothetical protein